jgi:hypothetical protein
MGGSVILIGSGTGDQRMFVVGHACDGVAFGFYEDELEDLR